MQQQEDASLSRSPLTCYLTVDPWILPTTGRCLEISINATSCKPTLSSLSTSYLACLRRKGKKDPEEVVIPISWQCLKISRSSASVAEDLNMRCMRVLDMMNGNRDQAELTAVWPSPQSPRSLSGQTTLSTLPVETPSLTT